MAKRSHGEGTIRRRSDGRWECRIMDKNGTEPIVSIEKVVQYAIVVRLWSNHGRKVPHHPRKVPHKQKKALKTNGFQGFDGGDKRDRTADLLNAIQALSQLSYTPECLDILSQNKWIVKDFFIFFLTKCKRILNAREYRFFICCVFISL